MKRLVKNLRREFLIFWGIPKNIYMPISIFSIIFVIFTIIDSNYLLGFSNVFIASLFIALTVSNQKHIEIFIQNDRNTQTVNQNHEFIKNFYKIKYVNNSKEDLDLVLTSTAHQLILKGLYF